MGRKFLFLLMIGLAVLVNIGTAQASLTFIGSRGSLAGTDYIDWGTAGALTNPFAITSNGGINFDVSKTITSGFTRLDQGSGWSGNFAYGDRLLYSSSGPMIIDSYSLLWGAGTQIQANHFGNFIATIEALDSSDNSLGSYTFPGYSDASGDNSAMFLGVLSDSQDIDKIVLDVLSTDAGPRDFAINQFDLVTTGSPPGPVIPEPASLTLLGAGLFGLLGLKKKK